MSILPLPSTRVSNYLARTRLVQQTQADQLELFRLQYQISTGRRIFRPSEDGPSALRSIGLQRTLERKAQVQTNLQGAQAALTSAESKLNGVGDILNEVRAQVLGVSTTLVSDDERLKIQDISFQAIDSLVNLANSTYQDSYLFAGSRSLTSPYVYNGRYVEYRGDETTQQQRIDVGVLFDVSMPGGEIFGGLSEPVRGSVDLNPQLTPRTRLSEINRGGGVTVGGSIEIAYLPAGSPVESESVIIDLSSARTVGDVARLIELGGPETADLRVTVTGSGLLIEVEPDAASPGRVVVREVAGGETASELGILSETPATAIAGADLDATIRLTTLLGDLQGTKAVGRLSLPGVNNDLILNATGIGDAFNDLTVEIRDGAPIGSETATFTPGAPPTLVVNIAAGVTTAAQIAAAINAETSGAFQAEIDYRDALSANKAGAGGVGTVTQTLVTSGGGGEPLDLASGLLITNGEDPFVIDTSGAETVEDLLNLLNRSENGIFAELNSTGTGIDVRTRRSGADFSIGEGASGGQLATQLGIRTYTVDSRLEDFNRGKGVLVPPLEDINGNIDPTSITANRFVIEVTDAGNTTTYDIDLTGNASISSDDDQTVQDVIDAIFDQTGGEVVATLAAEGNGLTLTPTGSFPAIPVAVPATGSTALAGDTLTFTAVAGGAAGNQEFSLEVIDSGTGGLTVNVVDGAIRVDLGGAVPDPTTADIAAAIENELADFTVASSGAASVTAASHLQSPVDFVTAGGEDVSLVGVDEITISGDAAGRFGFFDADATSASSLTGSITSGDRHTLEADSVFNSLLRLTEALSRGDGGVPDIGRAIERLDDDLNRVTSGRGEIGARLQSLESVQFRLEDEEVELRTTLSEELDVDLTQAISDFTARQFSLQASLQTTANLLQLSILDFV